MAGKVAAKKKPIASVRAAVAGIDLFYPKKSAVEN